MGLGTTAKKLQKVTEMAENVYQRLNELRAQISEMRETTGETQATVDRLETETAEIRAIVEAIADQEDIDTETVIADAHITEAEAETAESAAESGSDSGL
jgi:hypothetical protein